MTEHAPDGIDLTAGFGGKSDAELRKLFSAQAVIALGVPQGLNVRAKEPATVAQIVIRRAEEFLVLPTEVANAWSTALLPRSPDELAALVTERAAPQDAKEILGYLHEQDLLASFDAGPSWTAWSRRLRVLPMAVGLGNTAADPTLYTIRGLHSSHAVSVDALSYWVWLSWDGASSIYHRAQELAADVDEPFDVVLSRARVVLLACLNAGLLLVDVVEPEANVGAEGVR